MKHTGKIVNNDDIATKKYCDTLAGQYASNNDLNSAVIAKANAAANAYKSGLNEIYQNVATIDVMYPVGAAYATLSSTFDPNTTFTGTTWVQLEDWIFLTQKADSTKGGTLYIWQRTA